MQAQQKIDWDKCTPKMKADIIANLYDPGGTSASEMAMRIFQVHGSVVSRNAVIGTYGRMPELREKYPLTGGNRSKSKSNSSKSPFMSELLARKREERRVAKEEKKRLDQERKVRRDRAFEAPGEDGSPSRMERIERRSRELLEYNEANALNLSLVDLEQHHCRWPIGTSNFKFCGVDRQSDTPYCKFHGRLAYNRLAIDE